MNNRVLVISPHADDATIFIGGIIKQLSNSGSDVYIARVTNDDFDAFGVDEKTAIINNRNEAEEAYKVLGVKDVIHMGYLSDYIFQADYNMLRGDIVKLIRTIKPFSIYGFDIDGRNEDNTDHKIIAKATSEALWISSFSLHYKEQLVGDIQPFCVASRNKFMREGDTECKCIDISDVIDSKVEALKKHRTMLNNILTQAIMRAKSYGADVPITAEVGLESIVDTLCRQQAQIIGANYNIQYGEIIKEESAGLAAFFL